MRSVKVFITRVMEKYRKLTASSDDWMEKWLILNNSSHFRSLENQPIVLYVWLSADHFAGLTSITFANRYFRDLSRSTTLNIFDPQKKCCLFSLMNLRYLDGLCENCFDRIQISIFQILKIFIKAPRDIPILSTISETLTWLMCCEQNISSNRSSILCFFAFDKLKSFFWHPHLSFISDYTWIALHCHEGFIPSFLFFCQVPIFHSINAITPLNHTDIMSNHNSRFCFSWASLTSNLTTSYAWSVSKLAVGSSAKIKLGSL